MQVAAGAAVQKRKASFQGGRSCQRGRRLGRTEGRRGGGRGKGGGGGGGKRGGGRRTPNFGRGSTAPLPVGPSSRRLLEALASFWALDTHSFAAWLKGPK